MAVYFPKKKHLKPVPVSVSDFNTNYYSFQEQVDQQCFLQISVSLFPFTAKYPGSQTEY